MFLPWEHAVLKAFDPRVWLVTSHSAFVAERQGYVRYPWHQAGALVDRSSPWELRQFVERQLGPFDPRVRQLDEAAAVRLAGDLLQSGELVAICEGAADAPADGAQAEPSERRLVAELARHFGGAIMNVAGGRYRLVPGYALARLGGREEYVVVPRAEADAILERAARETPNPAVGERLTEVRLRLAGPWRQPRTPEGLVLLRHQPPPVSASDEPPITPAAFKKLAREQSPIEIEIVVVAPNGKPWKGRVEVVAPDGEELDEALDGRGSFSFKSLKPGACDVRAKPR